MRTRSAALPIFLALLSLYVVWCYEGPGYRDILEAAESPAGPWEQVAGPYTVKDGEYWVAVPIGDPVPLPCKFFRVSRVYGPAWVSQ